MVDAMTLLRRISDWIARNSGTVKVNLAALEIHLQRMDQQIGLVPAESLMREHLRQLDLLGRSTAVSPRKQREVRQLAAALQRDWRELEIRSAMLRRSLHEERRALMPDSFWARALAPQVSEQHVYQRHDVGHAQGRAV
jgi:hypothetical protein